MDSARPQGSSCVAAGVLVVSRVSLFAVVLFAGCEPAAPPLPPRPVEVATSRSMIRSADGSRASVKQLLGEAEQAIVDENEAAAEFALKELLLQDPGHVRALFLMARLNGESDRLNEAIDLLAAIPSDDRMFGLAALGQRADYLRQIGQLNESIEVWREILQLDDSLDSVREFLVDDLYASGKRVEAGWELAEMVRRGVANEDHLRRLLNVTRWPKSREQIVEEQRKASEQPADSEEAVEASQPSTLGDAWDLIHEKRFRIAMQLLERIVDTDPSNEALSLLAMTQTDLQQYDLMHQTVSLGTEGIKRYPGYWIAIGDDWASQQKDDHAIAAYAQALWVEPTFELSHQRLIGALLRKGETELARKIDERRFALPGPIEAFVAVGPRQPEDIRAAKYLISDLQQLGQLEQACAWLRSVAPRHPEAFGDSEAVTRQCREMTSLPEEERRRVVLAGMELQDYPNPDMGIELSNRLSGSDAKQAFVPDGPPATPVLVNVAEQVGIEFAYHNLPDRVSRLMRLHESLGGGGAVLDYDLDGWIDFYFGQSSADPPEIMGTRPNALFRHVGNRFLDVTDFAGVDDRGYSICITAGDWNQDGFDDIVVGNLGVNRIFINQGDGSFVDRTESIGIDADTFTSSLALADVNSDTLVDLIEVNYADDPSIFDPLIVMPSGMAANYPGPNKFRSGLDVVWLANPDGTAKRIPLGSEVSEVNREAAETTGMSDRKSVPQIGDDANPGLGLAVTDFDGSTGLEFFITNDTRPNQYWRVKGPPESVQLSQVATTAGLATSCQGKTTACMGVTVADFDRNGMPDLVVTNWFDEWLCYYQQKSHGVFRDTAPLYGLDRFSDHHVGFGLQAIDYDNNGWVDLMIGNGHIDDFTHSGQAFRMRPQLLVNRGDHFIEADMPSSSELFWSTLQLTRTVIACDYNRDGRLDAVTTDLELPVAVIENRTEADPGFLQFQVVGTRAERSAIGTRIEILDSIPPLIAMVTAGTGYAGRPEPLVHFGLGNRVGKVDIRVTWPDGSTQRHNAVQPGARYLLIEKDSIVRLD
ncbi:FG-GAP-like repeat-containing protein [Novipirellula artificiosorum]|uniref:FG-GAP-like repeat-containing protein n=1 Tax=Novipirellula artificiosorum TaxID=2528016 RepID=UPI0018CE4DC2|nr:FG-GAP-like repeat-containing protein [Novipirellula artificiosorum]